MPTDDDANQQKQVLSTMPILEDIGTIRQVVFIHQVAITLLVAGLTVNNWADSDCSNQLILKPRSKATHIM